MLIIKALLLAASMAIAAPSWAQQPPATPVAPVPDKLVEGDTPERVAQVASCQGHKFEARIEIDPVKKRSTSVKLCANPGASDADWVKTLEAAIVQIEQRNMPLEARQKLIGEMRVEIARFAAKSNPVAAVQATTPFVTDPGASISRAGTSERYETSVLPPLPPPKSARRASAAITSPPQRPMRVGLTCFERGQTGAGGTCNFLESTTIFSIRAVEGLEDGATVRFLRRGDVRREIALASMQAGQSTRVKLPAELCRGVSSTKVEIEFLRPKSTGAVAARLGPFGLIC